MALNLVNSDATTTYNNLYYYYYSFYTYKADQKRWTDVLTADEQTGVSCY